MQVAITVRRNCDVRIVIHHEHGEGVHVVGLVEFIGEFEAQPAGVRSGVYEVVNVGTRGGPCNRTAECSGIQPPGFTIPAIDQWARYRRRASWRGVVLSSCGHDGHNGQGCHSQADH